MNDPVQPGLNVYTGNRLERLVEQLARIIQVPLRNPFAEETIIVQSRGMERYISLELAEKNKISANSVFPFPNKFLHDIFNRIETDLPEDSPFEKDILCFRIMKILPKLVNQPEFKNLKMYLEDDDTGLKLFQVSEKIADIFDQYLVFRPDMIFQWEKANETDLHEDSWQPILWRSLVHSKSNMHRARIRKKLIQRLSAKRCDFGMLPERINIFGISYLPVFHLETFAEISKCLQVNLFVLNHCVEYWADIMSDKETRRFKAKLKKPDIQTRDLYIEKGNPLLASMGGTGRDFFSFLCEFESVLIDVFQGIECHNMLSCVQSDILYLRERKSQTDDPEPIDMDQSIQIHSCHSPLREMEVLYDHLLEMFEQDHKLLPKDIIVMTPDIEAYAPYAHIIFGTQTDPSMKIPYSIADQSIRKESRLMDGFLNLLSLKGTRFSVSQVMGLLEMPGVKEQFGLSDSNIEKIEHWVHEVNIRWGIDSANREKMGLPGFSENTWKAGLERFLLGYAMPGYDTDLFNGILPYDHIEGKDTEILGKFLEFIGFVFESVELLEKPKSLNHWAEVLDDILKSLFEVHENMEHEYQIIRRVIHELGRKETISDYDEKLDLSVIQAYMENHFQNKSFGYGFLSGGVTICAMLPMRSIPFKIVCLVGMNSDLFPREVRPLGFDLIAKFPKKGDRSPRDDDKYLFLESILSARQKLYISYTGQSIQDNSKIPPSPLVSELVDTLKKGYGINEDQLIVKHRLQAFSPMYYQENQNGLFSYSEENLHGARSLQKVEKPSPFNTSDLSEPPEEMKQLNITTLSDFYSNPARYILKNRLDMVLGDRASEYEDSENFSLDGLDRYQIGQMVLNNSITGGLDNELDIQKAMGILPHGKIGRYYFKDIKIEVNEFIDKIAPYIQDEESLKMDVDLEVSDFKITGNLSNIYGIGNIIYRYAKQRTVDLISAWASHLILCSIKDTGCTKKTTLICKDSTWEFSQVDKSLEILEHLLEQFWIGLKKPLNFFPNSSYGYAEQVLLKNKSVNDALKISEREWLGNDFSNFRGEGEDNYINLCFRTTQPLDTEFQTIALDFFKPLFDNSKKIL